MRALLVAVVAIALCVCPANSVLADTVTIFTAGSEDDFVALDDPATPSSLFANWVTATYGHPLTSFNTIGGGR